MYIPKSWGIAPKRTGERMQLMSYLGKFRDDMSKRSKKKGMKRKKAFISGGRTEQRQQTLQMKIERRDKAKEIEHY